MRKDWEIKNLGEIGKPSMCKRILKSQTSSTGEIPFYKIGTFGKKPDAFISKEIYNEFRTKYSFPKKGDILISASGTIGRRVRYDGKPAFFQDSNIVWIDNDEKQVLNDYLYIFYEFCDWQPSKGATISRLYNSDLTSIKIAFPKTHSEQKEIILILNDAFESIERAKSNAEQNLKNAKELFESYLQNIFHKKGDEWEEKKLDEIAEVEYGYTDKSKEEGHYRYIRITDIDKNGELILSEKKYINYSKEASGFIVQNNDLLMARTGATFAKVLLYDGDEPSVFASYLIRIKFKVNIENELYWYFTKTPNYWEQANSLQSGAAQPHFNGAAVKQVIFPYPKSVTEQKRLIHSFQRLSKETKKLEIIYQQKLNDLEELKKSILQKAFNGELKTSKTPA